MKRKIKIIFSLLASCIAILCAPKQASAQRGEVSYQVFYDELSPYGTWVDNADYGYVWVPDVAPGFTPYGTNGYWASTNEGWTWVSNYSWGWAPFHYGRWYYDPNYGPMWVPGNEWGPGWVTWRRSEGYYGWAPIGPGISISIAYGNGYDIPYNHWRFVRDRDFGRTNITNYYVNSSNNTTIINNSTVINNTYVNNSNNVTYNYGPDRREVERRSGRTINTVAISDDRRPGQHISNNQLQLYRPRMERSNPKSAPTKVVSIREMKTSQQRSSEPNFQHGNQTIRKQPMQPKNDKQIRSGNTEQPPLNAEERNRQIQQQGNQHQNRGGEKPSQRRDQPVKQERGQPQRNSEPARQSQQQQQQQNPRQQNGGSKPPQQNQPARQEQPQRQDRPQRQQPQQQQEQQRQEQPQRQQQQQRQDRPQRQEQPQRQQPPQQQRSEQPKQQQPQRQQQSQPQQNNQHSQQPSAPSRKSAPKGKDDDKQPH